ncbi:MAG: exodeoxyribonuclease VII small subunit [Fibrobacterota bacterium]
MAEKRKRTTFEDALQQLEASVRFLETEEVSLDDSLKHFEQGIRAVEKCRRHLNRAEGKIQKLLETPAGDFIKETMNVDIEDLIGGQKDFE